jgi:hypothetical protein
LNEQKKKLKILTLIITKNIFNFNLNNNSLKQRLRFLLFIKKVKEFHEFFPKHYKHYKL